MFSGTYTVKILTDGTHRVIHQSRVCLAKIGENNLKLDTKAGAVPTRVYIKTKHDSESNKTIHPTVNMFNNPFTTEFDDKVNKEETFPENSRREDLDAATPMDSTPLKDRGDPLLIQEEDLPDHLKDPK